MHMFLQRAFFVSVFALGFLLYYPEAFSAAVCVAVFAAAALLLVLLVRSFKRLLAPDDRPVLDRAFQWAFFLPFFALGLALPESVQADGAQFASQIINFAYEHYRQLQANPAAYAARLGLGLGIGVPSVLLLARSHKRFLAAGRAEWLFFAEGIFVGSLPVAIVGAAVYAGEEFGPGLALCIWGAAGGIPTFLAASILSWIKFADSHRKAPQKKQRPAQERNREDTG